MRLMLGRDFAHIETVDAMMLGAAVRLDNTYACALRINDDINEEWISIKPAMHMMPAAPTA